MAWKLRHLALTAGIAAVAFGIVLGDIYLWRLVV